MEIGLLVPCLPERLERAKVLGLTSLELRLGPGFPIDTDDPELREAREAAGRLRSEGFKVPVLGFYRNHLAPDAELRGLEARRLGNVLRMASLFGAQSVSVFAGRDPELPLEENYPLFKEVWTPIARQAEELGVRIGIENCTMYRGYPVKGINIAYCPAACERLFELVPSPALGIEFDPSHCLKQFIDPLPFLRAFGDRIVHFHAKDHQRDAEALQAYGCFDVRTSTDRFPGFGEVDFTALFAELIHLGYDGPVTIEAERDPDFSTEEEIRAGLTQSVHRLREALILASSH